MTRSRDSVVQLRNKPLRDLTGEALRTYFRDLNGHKPGDLPQSERILSRHIALPMHPALTDDDVAWVIRSLELALAK